ncbi:hypothetical protein KKC1_33580 [Calderihabitans maritimus]|uniref:Uncharacterized protein n=1 Tax=Calderihabitans maritimus TaxID=1246530 RepID=A0A1Z5HXZ6_9FIRM|nr:hypothetical protein KKC1_33580 [Calderihabitans maritimus]
MLAGQSKVSFRIVLGCVFILAGGILILIYNLILSTR